MAHILGYLISYLIEGVAIWHYGSLFEEEKNTLQRFIMLSCFYFVLFLVAINDIKWLNAYLYISANFLFFFLQYNLKWFTALFHSILITALMSMCELGIYALMEQITPHFFTQTYSFFLTINYVVLSKFTFLVLIFIIVSIGKLFQSSKETSKISLLYMFMPFSSIFAMILFIYIFENTETDELSKTLVILVSLLIITSNILLFCINQYTQKYMKEYYEMKLLSEKEKHREEYYHALKEQNEKQRILVHDIKKHLRSIQQLNLSNYSKEIETYINNILLSDGIKNPITVSDSEMLNSIILFYQKKCETNGISFSTDIRSKVVDFLNYTDLTSLFGNLLDNATESAEKVQIDPFIDLYIHQKEGTTFVCINMINSCLCDANDKTHSFETNKINKNMHGLGLKSIQNIVTKYNGNIEMHYDYEHLEFHTNIILVNNSTHV